MKNILLVFSIILIMVFNIHHYCNGQNVDLTFEGKTVIVMKNVDSEMKLSESKNMEVILNIKLSELKFSFKKDTLEVNGNISTLGFLDSDGNVIDSEKFNKLIAKGKVVYFCFICEKMDGRSFIFSLPNDFSTLKYFDSEFPDEIYTVLK